MRRNAMPHFDRTAVLLGLALIAYGLCAAYFVASMAWGGIFFASGLVQAMVFGPGAALVLGGATLASYGGYLRCSRRRRSD